jgi:glycosyltransferase involved in cell wall biosynthesis
MTSSLIESNRSEKRLEPAVQATSTDSDISVIMPSYNKGEYIKYAIESVLGQTYPNFQLIIVDDCSIDSSLSIAESFAQRDNRIRLIRHSTNRGVSEALNDGIRLANTRFVTFIGSDDIFAPDRLETMLKASRETSSTVVAYSKTITVDEDAKNIEGKDSPKASPEGDVFGRLLIHSFLRTGIILLPKACFDSVGFYDPTMKFEVDYELALRLARAFKFRYVARATYGYRMYGGNMVRRNPRSRVYAVRAGILEKHFLPNIGILDRETRVACFRKLFMYYAGSRQWSKIIRESIRHTDGLRALPSLFPT